MSISPSNLSVFRSLTDGQRARILAAATGTTVEGVHVTDRIKWELQQYETGVASGSISPTPPPPSAGATPSASLSVYKYAPTINAATLGSGTTRYPNSPGIDANSDYVIFEFFKYAPPFGRRSGTAAPSASTSTSPTASAYDLYNQSNRRSYASPSDIKPIILYMPEDVQVEFGADWQGAAFGAAQAGLARSAGTQLSALQQAVNAIPSTVKTTAYQAIVDGINKVTGGSISLNQLIGGVSGNILNPNVEMMYEGPRLRNFSLSFKMTPRDEPEAKSIRRICNRFKKAMLPTYGGEAADLEATTLITVPDLCQVTYMKGSNRHDYLPLFKLCAITNVSINYTPDGSYATYSDGSPVATELRVSFSETKLVFGDEIAEEGDTF